MSYNVAEELRRLADSGDFHKHPSEVMRAAADFIDKAHATTNKPRRSYTCLRCDHTQDCSPADFKPGQAPLCEKCHGTLKRIRDNQPEAPRPFKDDPPFPITNDPTEPCPFDTSTPGTNPAQQPGAGPHPRQPSPPEHGTPQGTNPLEATHLRGTNTAPATPAFELAGGRGNQQNSPQVNSQTEKAAVPSAR